MQTRNTGYPFKMSQNQEMATVTATVNVSRNNNVYNSKVRVNVE